MLASARGSMHSIDPYRAVHKPNGGNTMGMTMTQKILAAHCGEAAVTAGQLINAQLDIVLGNDITTPVAINEFEKAGFDSVFDRTRVNIVLDHFVPNKTK